MQQYTLINDVLHIGRFRKHNLAVAGIQPVYVRGFSNLDRPSLSSPTVY